MWKGIGSDGWARNRRGEDFYPKFKEGDYDGIHADMWIFFSKLSFSISCERRIDAGFSEIAAEKEAFTKNVSLLSSSLF